MVSANESRTVGVAVGRVGVGIAPADVSAARSSQKSVHQRVHRHVRVRVSNRAPVRRDVHAGDPQRPVGSQPVQVIAGTDPVLRDRRIGRTGPRRMLVAYQ